MSWDDRYLSLARLVSTWSKDPSTQAGAVIVAPRRRIVSVGFNGFPRVMPDKPEWYADREEKYSRIIHAEKNALLFAGLLPEGCTLYTWPLFPCDRCCVEMLQAGIMHYVFPAFSLEQYQRWSWPKTKRYLDECGATYALLTLADTE